MNIRLTDLAKFTQLALVCISVSACSEKSMQLSGNLAESSSEDEFEFPEDNQIRKRRDIAFSPVDVKLKAKEYTVFTYQSANTSDPLNGKRFRVACVAPKKSVDSENTQFDEDFTIQRHEYAMANNGKEWMRINCKTAHIPRNHPTLGHLIELKRNEYTKGLFAREIAQQGSLKVISTGIKISCGGSASKQIDPPVHLKTNETSADINLSLGEFTYVTHLGNYVQITCGKGRKFHTNSYYFHDQSEPKIAGYPKGKGWKIVWKDEFNGKEEAIRDGEPAACFDIPVVCSDYGWGGRKAKCSYQPDPGAIADLNRCRWRIYDYTPNGNGPTKDSSISTWDPRMVSVKNGHLVLSNKKNPGKSDDCGRAYEDPNYPGTDLKLYSSDCPFLQGYVDTLPIGASLTDASPHPGFSKTFGRFEFRAKLLRGPGTWPALWLLADYSEHLPLGWPHSGEIDVVELSAKKSFKPWQSLHSGDQATGRHTKKDFDWEATKKFYPNLTKSQRESTFGDDFHTYGIEWEPTEIRFFIDGHLTGRVRHNELATDGEKIKELKLPISIPQNPMNILLQGGLGYHADWGKNGSLGKVDANNFQAEDMLVDWIRVYDRCDENDDPSSCRTEFPESDEYSQRKESCPKTADQLGTHNGKPVCKGVFATKITQMKCLKKDHLVWNEYCLKEKKGIYAARKLSNPTPANSQNGTTFEGTHPCKGLGTNVGTLDSMPVCRKFAAMGIKAEKCEKKSGQIWKNFCVWRDGPQYDARPIRGRTERCYCDVASTPNGGCSDDTKALCTADVGCKWVCVWINDDSSSGTL